MRITIPKPKPVHTVVPVSYCVEDAARALGIGRTFAFNLIKEGKLKAVHIGRRTLVPVAEVEAFMSRRGGAA